jgi:UDP-3-O-[3-hydroxymyristoyl] glucosamine N-acyltransferase
MPLFYFHGVNGAVPANRHKNPDGSLGGWVADTAFVCSGVHVGLDVMVFERAKVFDSVVLSGKTKVFGQAEVSGNVKISDEAWVFDQAVVTDQVDLSGEVWVFGHALISRNAKISGNTRVGGIARVGEGVILTKGVFTRENLTKICVAPVRMSSGTRLIGW